MLLCVCKAVRPPAVVDAVRRGASTVEAVSACTGAGTGCGVCVDELRRLVAATREGEGIRRVAGAGACLTDAALAAK